METDVGIKILGGGISGLSLGYYLKKYLQAPITIFEKESRPGGMIASHYVGDFFFEKGPRTFMTSRSSELLSLIDELGLKDELIFAQPQKRYIYYKGKLRSLKKMLPHIAARGVFRDLWTPPKSGDESIRNFGERRFGKWVTDHILDPMTSGIYAGSIDQLSVQKCFPSLKKMELAYGSVIKGLKSPPKGSLFTLKGGMDMLIAALAERCQIITGSCDAPQYSTIPQPGYFNYTGLQVVHLAYAKNLLKKGGFGYLVPSVYGRNVLGVVFDSCVFPQQNVCPEETRLTVMLRPCQDPLDEALKAVCDDLQIDQFPLQWAISKFDHAIPQMGIDHDSRLAQLKKDYPNTIFAGNFVKGPAVNQCVSLAQELASQALSQVHQGELLNVSLLHST